MTQPRPRGAWVEISLSAIEANLWAIRSLLDPETKIMAIVKANAYGHGAVEVAVSALRAGANRLGVALPQEGIELRLAGIGVPIQVLSETSLDCVDDAVEHRLICTVYSAEAAEALSNAAVRKGKKAIVHMKVDTGMHRVGVRPKYFKGLFGEVAKLPGIEVEGCFTHFAMADDPSDPYTAGQLQEFLKLREQYRDEIPMWHAANSAGTFFFPDSRLDMVRIGIAMYGLRASSHAEAPVHLHPALSLKAKLGYLQVLEAGEGVSYGQSFKASKKTRIGTLPLGYADGYSRLLSNKAEVIVAGRRVPVAGTICMDQFMVDVGETACEPGDAVTLIGKDGDEQITIEELAVLMGTINYEVACMMGGRLPRVYLPQ